MKAGLPRHRDQLALVAIFAAILILFGLLSGSFLSASTFASVANRIPTLTLVATGMTLVLVIGGIDLSVGSVMALGGAVFAVLMVDWGWPFPAAVLGCVGVGLAVGLFNGWITERLRVPSFIVTLGSLEAARGLAYLCTGSQTKYLAGKVEWLARPVGGTMISPALVLAVAAVVAAQFVLSRMVWGRQMVAIGTNEVATQLAGIRTRRVKVLVFAASGGLAGVAALCQLARLGACDPNAGSGLELSAIAAAVIGGTSLSGGRGSVASTFLGVLIIATLESGLVHVGATEPVKRVVTGAVIVAAVLVDTWRKRRG
ncbi:MAG: ABC transporter permease [Verrucomicrobiales bacterium]|nr:ABC transporter permease [Verrucomicrobiales bacterium]